jgi:hypothetical protein
LFAIINSCLDFTVLFISPHFDNYSFLGFVAISGGGINIDEVVVWVKIYLFIEFIIIKNKKRLNM